MKTTSKIKTTSRMKMTSKMKTNSKMKTTSKMKKTSKTHTKKFVFTPTTLTNRTNLLSEFFQTFYKYAYPRVH